VTGAILSPMSAFLLLQGIETVSLRVERHVENGRKVAQFLRQDGRVEWVNYAGFPESPYYVLAGKYLRGHATSLMTFGVKGGFEAGKAFLVMTAIVDRTFGGRVADLQGNHSFVWPVAGLEEGLISLGRDKDIVESLGRRGRDRAGWAVDHSQAGAQINPFAIIVWAQELAVAGEPRFAGRAGLSGKTQKEQREGEGQFCVHC